MKGLRYALYLAYVLCGLAILGGIAMWVVAIWTVGPDSSRWGMTAVLAVSVGFVGGMGTSIAMIEVWDRERGPYRYDRDD